jgi:hypothetical protein
LQLQFVASRILSLLHQPPLLVSTTSRIFVRLEELSKIESARVFP